MVVFDGFPVDRMSQFPAHDATALLQNWERLDGRLEGQFVAVRVDLVEESVECITDAVGIAPLYSFQHGGNHLLSNSVEAIRTSVGLAEPDPLGVSCFLSLGWAAADRVLLRDVRALRGGHRYRLKTSGFTSRVYMSSATIAAEAHDAKSMSTPELVRDLVGLTSTALSKAAPVKCALTGGRDSRVVLALLEAAGAEHVRYHTIGSEADCDVRIARSIANVRNLSYERWAPSEFDASGDVIALIKMFVAQSDGLSSLNQIGEYGDQLTPFDRIGLKVSGLGGEIGRGGITAIRFGGTLPVVRRSSRLHTALMRRVRPAFKGLLRPEAMSVSTDYLRRFAADRRAEGWQVRDLSESFYAFDRSPRMTSAGLRRTSAVDDFFSPFCSQAFIRYCFSLSPAERYLEAPHYRIMSSLAPQLRDMEYQRPWRPQVPRLAALLASYELMRLVADRAVKPRVQLGRRSTGEPLPRGAAVDSVRWFERHIETHRDLCLSLPQSPLWEWVDRAAVESAFRADPAARGEVIEGLLRVVTLFWYFHGREAT